MINGIQKYLMIALSAVFLWMPSIPLYAQEIETITLPMEKVALHYNGDVFLLTQVQAKKLDTIALHMQNKSKMQIIVSYTTNKNSKLTLKRLTIVEAYLRDNGVGEDRIIFKSTKDENCLASCPNDIIVTESSES